MPWLDTQGPAPGEAGQRGGSSERPWCSPHTSAPLLLPQLPVSSPAGHRTAASFHSPAEGQGHSAGPPSPCCSLSKICQPIMAPAALGTELKQLSQSWPASLSLPSPYTHSPEPVSQKPATVLTARNTFCQRPGTPTHTGCDTRVSGHCDPSYVP